MSQGANEPISLWEKTAPEPSIGEPLDGDAVTEVAIIGGGYTGLSTALHCAEAGIAAHVLEAERVGFGGSGRNVGLVNAGVWLPPQIVRERLGPVHGPRFVDAFSRGPDCVFSLIERYGIACEAMRSGTIHAAHAPSGLEDLRSRYEEWRRLGAPVDLLGRKEAREMTGTAAFHGGLLDHRAGTINPMGYCRGLARAARAAGARISTETRARKLRREGERWRIETDRGTVTADKVVLATNAYTDGLWPGLSRSHTIIHFHQLATTPLGDRAAQILPGGQGLWDTGAIMLSLRKDAFGRLVIGSMGRVITGFGGDAASGLSHRWVSKRIAQLFPAFGAVEIEEAWHGRIAMTPDHLPRIHRLADNLLTAIGYNGRGIAPGTLFGKALAELLAGADQGDLPLPVSDMRTDWKAPFMAPLYDLAFTASQAWKSL